MFIVRARLSRLSTFRGTLAIENEPTRDEHRAPLQLPGTKLVSTVL